MEGRAARPIVLSQIQSEILEGIVRQRHCPQAIALRARVVLLAGQGVENMRIARQLACHRDLARRWRGRFADAQERWAGQSQDWDAQVWREKIAEVLEDRERSGAPAKFTPEQLCQIVALACEKRPEECDRPVTHWTARELADEAVKRQIVVSISPRHVGRFLKAGGPAAAPGASLGQQPRPGGEPAGVYAAL
jgi:Homeodomain-like domain